MDNLPTTRVQRQRLLTTKLRVLGIKAHDYIINRQGLNLSNLCLKRTQFTQYEQLQLLKLSNAVCDDKNIIPFFAYLHNKLD